MSDNSDLREHLNNAFNELKALGEEIRLKVHLASMDAQSKWAELEPKIREVEHKLEAEGEKVEKATAEMVKDVVQAFKDLREKIKG